MRLIRDEVMWEGTIDEVQIYPRELIRRALEVGASGIALAHNHPSGDPTPSSADKRLTFRIADAARAIGIKMHGHAVIGRTRGEWIDLSSQPA